MLRTKEKQSDIVFQAAENLLNQATGEIALTKNSFKSLPIAGERTFESYVHEFCGIAGVPMRCLRFLMEHRDVSPNLVITSSCLVKVSHLKEGSPSDFAVALTELFDSGIGSDVKVRFAGREAPCQSCVLASRSPVFAKLLGEERKEPVIELREVDEKSADTFANMLRWVHTGVAEFSEDIFVVIGLLDVATRFELAGLVTRCEEDIRGKLCAENVLDILTRYGGEKASSPLSEDIWNECKSMFLREFTYIQQLNVDLETRVAAVPGLMSQLFSHAANAKRPKKNRHVRFSVD